MRFLVDECTGPGVARWLAEQGHDVYSVFNNAPGTPDEELVVKAFAENRIIITNDKDFGEQVFREKKPHKGIILLRLENERTHNKIRVLKEVLHNYPDKLTQQFVVVTERKIRFAQQ